MQKLKDKIMKEGTVEKGHLIKVDSFLNHQIDTGLMSDIGAEFYRKFKNEKVTKILTIESSGIAIALMTGVVFNVPVVFAKKQKSLNLGDHLYACQVFSYTKQVTYDISVAKDYLKPKDSVLIVDDFLASGNALAGLVDIVEQSQAKVAGVGIVIEKAFQQGGDKIREKGIRLVALASIQAIEDGKILFAR